MPGSRPVLRENYLLEPRQKNLSATVRMFDYWHTASLCAVQEGRPPAFWRALEDRLNELARVRTQQRASRLGCEHARFGRSGRAGIEQERMLRP